MVNQTATPSQEEVAVFYSTISHYHMENVLNGRFALGRLFEAMGRKLKVDSSYLAFARTINSKRFFSTRKLFSEKHTHAEILVNTILPARCIYYKHLIR